MRTTQVPETPEHLFLLCPWILNVWLHSEIDLKHHPTGVNRIESWLVAVIEKHNGLLSSKQLRLFSSISGKPETTSVPTAMPQRWPRCAICVSRCTIRLEFRSEEAAAWEKSTWFGSTMASTSQRLYKSQYLCGLPISVSWCFDTLCVPRFLWCLARWLRTNNVCIFGTAG